MIYAKQCPKCNSTKLGGHENEIKQCLSCGALWFEPIPNSPQERLLKSSVREVGFGGQAGGSKSFTIVLDALYQLPKKNYNAILFRRTYPDLKAADGLVDLSKRIYPSLGGHFNKSDHLWTFPDYHNNTIRFSHMQHEKDAEMSGPQYPYIAYDELQEFTERQYLFMFSRNRSTNPEITPYIRSTFNPGGIGHFFIKKRFITPFQNCHTHKYFKRVNGEDVETGPNDRLAISRLFISSRLEDNPYLYRDGNSDYERGLSQLDSVDYARLRYGDWNIRRTGRVYHAFSDANIGPDASELDLSLASGFYHSHDFGAINHVYGIYAKLSGKYYKIHEQKLPEMTTQARADTINAHLKGRKVIAGWGGAASERQYRADFRQAGLPIRQPPMSSRGAQDSIVESQIRKTNDMFQANTLIICSNCTMTLDQLENCVRDDKGGITNKASWHYLDETRYFATGISRSGWGR